MRHLIAAVAVLAAGLALPVAASAEPGRTADRVNLRYGPSLEYRRVVLIPRGSPVEVRRCTPGHEWCEVGFGRYVGWVRTDYLLHPGHGRLYNVVGPELSLPVFDFNAHIDDFDRDRRYRNPDARHDDAWYRDMQRRHRGGARGHDDDRGPYRGRPDNDDNNDDYDDEGGPYRSIPDNNDYDDESGRPDYRGDPYDDDDPRGEFGPEDEFDDPDRGDWEHEDDSIENDDE
jgi:uncharacterized protein YraI